LHRDQARAAARIFRIIFELEDPADAEPISGPCPACGEKLAEAWACPSCELKFRPAQGEDDPLVAFVRDHGGFEES
jgi:hypothetical protein